MHKIKAHPQDDPIKYISYIESKDAPNMYKYLDAECYNDGDKGCGDWMSLTWVQACKIFFEEIPHDDYESLDFMASIIDYLDRNTMDKIVNIQFK